MAYLFFFHNTTLVVHIGSGMAAQQSFFFVYSMSKLSSSKFWVCYTVRMRELLLCCESSRKWHPATQTAKQRQLHWTEKFWHVLQKLIAVQPSMAEYEWTMYQMKVKLLCYNGLKSVFVISCFDFEKFGVKPVFPFFNSHCILKERKIVYTVRPRKKETHQSS